MCDKWTMQACVHNVSFFLVSCILVTRVHENKHCCGLFIPVIFIYPFLFLLHSNWEIQRVHTTDMDTSASPKRNVRNDTLKFITNLFSKHGGWLAIHPNTEKATSVAPSETANNYTMDGNVPESVRHHLRDGVLRVFKDHLINHVNLVPLYTVYAQTTGSPYSLMEIGNLYGTYGR